jgi:hypothetical protein
LPITSEKAAADQAKQAAEKKQIDSEQKVAVVAPTSSAPSLSPQETAKLVQSELRRVGCLTDAPDGVPSNLAIPARRVIGTSQSWNCQRAAKVGHRSDGHRCLACPNHANTVLVVDEAGLLPIHDFSCEWRHRG